MTVTHTRPPTRIPALSDTSQLRELAGRSAAEADTRRRLSQEVVAGIREAGFSRHFVPAELGGTQGSVGEVIEGVVDLARGCPSAGWLASLSAFSARFACHLPPAGREELWGADPDSVVAAGIVPSGTLTPVAAGYVVEGSWKYVSGSDVADWFLLCARVADAEQLRFVTLSREQVDIDPTWNAIGMAATSSHTVTVRGVQVSAARTFDRTELVSGSNETSTVPSHRVPFQAVGGMTFLAPLVGAALGAVDTFAQTVTDQAGHAARSALVEGAALADTARFLLSQNVDVVDHQLFTPAMMSRNERNAVIAAGQCRSAVDSLVRAAGTSGLTTDSSLQRFWRDVHVAASHVALRLDTAAIRTYPDAWELR